MDLDYPDLEVWLWLIFNYWATLAKLMEPDIRQGRISGNPKESDCARKTSKGGGKVWSAVFISQVCSEPKDL